MAARLVKTKYVVQQTPIKEVNNNKMNGFISNIRQSSRERQSGQQKNDEIEQKRKKNDKIHTNRTTNETKGMVSKSSNRPKHNNNNQTLNSTLAESMLLSTQSQILFFDPNKKQRDPFMLVDCQQFSDDLMPPFRVQIKLDALALMDLHAHCVCTEVIGCLGGFYCRVTRTLHVLVAEPCYSLDDHETKCEMDPVSQALALDKLERKNFQMVGWYHSHPKFLPNPSVRDIDTQNCYQDLFTNKNYGQKRQKTMDDNGDGSVVVENGTEMESHPFVAFIVSPFMVPSKESISASLTCKSFTRYEPIIDYPTDAKFYANNKIYRYHHQYSKSYCYFTQELNSLLASPIKCFWVGHSKYSKLQLQSKQRNLLIPYEMETIMVRDENFIPSITNRLSEMCQWLFQDHSKSISVVQLMKRYTRIGSINVTYLEKLIASLSHHLQNPSVLHLCTEYECERIRLECVSILTQELMDNNKSKRRN